MPIAIVKKKNNIFTEKHWHGFYPTNVEFYQPCLLNYYIFELSLFTKIIEIDYLPFSANDFDIFREKLE